MFSSAISFISSVQQDKRGVVERILRMGNISKTKKLELLSQHVTAGIHRECQRWLEREERAPNEEESEEEEQEEFEEEEYEEEEIDYDQDEEIPEAEEEEEKDLNDEFEQFARCSELSAAKIVRKVQQDVARYAAIFRQDEYNLMEFLKKSENDRLDFETRILRLEQPYSKSPINYSRLRMKPIFKNKKEEIVDETPLHECKCCMTEHEETQMLGCISVKDDDEEGTDEIHYACLECIQQNTEANKVDGKIADDGTGWPCFEVGCKNIYIWASIKKLLEETTVIHLEKRLDNAALREFDDKIESCKTCDFRAFVEQGPHIMKWFSCLNEDCRAQFCRVCKIDFAAHQGKTCDEADPVRKAAKERKNRLTELEDFLSAAKVRVCTKCKKCFTKDDDGSCNKMTCIDCGTTMCYICKQSGITYNHFGKECLLFTDTNETDRLLLNNAIGEAQKDERMSELLAEFNYTV